MTFDVRIGTVSFNCPLSFIEALNDFGGGQDRYAVAAQSGNTLLELTLLDAANQNPFSNDSLPLVPPPLSKFDDSKQCQVLLRSPPDPDFIYQIAANVTTLVPEPSTLFLVASGFAEVIAAAWAKRRRGATHLTCPFERGERADTLLDGPPVRSS